MPRWTRASNASCSVVHSLLALPDLGLLGEHVSDPVAQQFYLVSLLVNGLMMWAIWWYMSSGHRLVDPDLSPRIIRRHHLISSGVPASLVLLMALVVLGVGRLVNPLLLAYLFALGYVALGVYEGREPLPAEEVEESEAPGDAEPRGKRRSGEGSGRANG